MGGVRRAAPPTTRSCGSGSRACSRRCSSAARSPAPGCALQALLRNPLAEPFTLGISSGSSLAAVLAIRLGIEGALGGVGVGAAALLGALAHAAAGVAARADRQAPAAGDARARRRHDVDVLLGGVGADPVHERLHRGQPDAAVDDGRARLDAAVGGRLRDAADPRRARGADRVRRASSTRSPPGPRPRPRSASRSRAPRRSCSSVASLLVGAAIALAGPIGFVGLIVPHALRAVLGPDHRVLLPASMFGGAVLLTRVRHARAHGDRARPAADRRGHRGARRPVLRGDPARPEAARRAVGPRVSDPRVLRHVIESITPASAAHGEGARLTIAGAGTPVLERLAIALAGAQHTARPRAARRTIVVVAGDHGVGDPGIALGAAHPTVVAARAIADGSAALAQVARASQTPIVIVDAGAREPAAMPACAIRLGARPEPRSAARAGDDRDRRRARARGRDRARDLARRGRPRRARGRRARGRRRRRLAGAARRGARRAADRVRRPGRRGRRRAGRRARERRAGQRARAARRVRRARDRRARRPDARRRVDERARRARRLRDRGRRAGRRRARARGHRLPDRRPRRHVHASRGSSPTSGSRRCSRSGSATARAPAPRWCSRCSIRWRRSTARR